MVFQKKSGYTNPFRHLQSCLAKGDTDTLMRIAEEKEKGNLQSDSIHFTPYDEAVYSYMKLIVEENLPLAIL